MDRPERDAHTAPHSIFSKPDPEAPPPLPPPTPGKGSPDNDQLSPRVLVALGSAGAIALVLIGFIAFSVLGGGKEPVVAGDGVSPTPTASSNDEPTVTATTEPTPSPSATPEPTPAGPPVELAVGDWATVTADELHVRAGVGGDQESRYQLIRGSVVTVAEGPQPADHANWYRIASLGGATGWVSSGWIAEPYLETILNDPVLIRCGEVADPVFDLVDGAPQAREVLRIGDFAVPSSKLDEMTLATMELARGVRAETCVTAQVGSDGLPTLIAEPRASACGHAVAEGQAFWLRPAADQQAEVASQVKDPALVHPVLLAGSADNRQSSNFRTLLTMMSHDGAAGCIHASVDVDSGRVISSRSASMKQCSVVTEYNDQNLRLRPAAGGPSAWIKLPKDGSSKEEIPLERPIDVDISTNVYPEGMASWASSPFNYERKECA